MPGTLLGVLIVAGGAWLYGVQYRAGGDSVIGPSGGAATVTLSMAPGPAISPHIYGINYEWNLVPAAEFAAWAEAMNTDIHYALVRYPSGWNAEHYIWGQNEEDAWSTSDGNCYDPAAGSGAAAGSVRRQAAGASPCPHRSPGASPETVLGAAPLVSFVIPSRAYDTSGLQSDLAGTVATARTLVAQYGARVPIWEIGNEWWNQGNAHASAGDRAAILARYAQLVAAVAPAMKSIDPSIQIYATVDWQTPQDVAAVRQAVGASAWAAVDGISIHAYCGARPIVKASKDLGDYACSDIPSTVAQIRTLSGKTAIYDSEWENGVNRNTDDYGIRNATLTLFTVQDMAHAGIQAAAYWPGTDFGTQTTLVESAGWHFAPTATGVLFGWMSQYYEGHVLTTGGTLPAAAALNGNGDVTLFVPSVQDGPVEVAISLAGTLLTRVVSAQVLSVASPDNPGSSASRVPYISALPVTMSQGSDGPMADVALNPGTSGRGSGWEIARITFSQ